jgi:hypothetical protein
VADHAHLETTAEWPVCVGGSDPHTSLGAFGPTSLKTIVDSLDRVELLLPNVPPEEAAFLKKESKAASAAHDYERFNMVLNRSYYWPWKLRSDFGSIRKQLNVFRVTGRYKLASPDNIRREIASLLHLFFDLSEATRHWSQFTAKSTSPPDGPALSSMISNSSLLADYLTCLLELLSNKLSVDPLLAEPPSPPRPPD